LLNEVKKINPKINVITTKSSVQFYEKQGFYVDGISEGANNGGYCDGLYKGLPLMCNYDNYESSPIFTLSDDDILAMIMSGVG